MERWRLDTSTDLGLPFATQHDHLLVVASFVIACLAVSVLIPAVERFRASTRRLGQLFWIGTGALAMALGVWGMHFTNLLALQLPVAVGYTYSLTALSGVPLFFGVALTIAVCRASIRPAARLHIAATGLTTGFAAMHLISMQAMVGPLNIHYSGWVAAIAFSATLALFWLAMYSNVYWVIRTRNHWAARVLGSVLLGSVVTTAHYGAILATEFFPDPDAAKAVHELNGRSIGLAIGVAVSALVALLLMAIVVDRRLARIARSLSDSESRFKILAETSACAIFICESTFTYANPALSEITGYSAQDLRAMSVRALFGEALEDRMNQLESQGNSLVPLELSQEVEIQRRDGQVRWAYVTMSSVPRSAGRCFIGSAYDFTERKQMESRLRHLAFFDSLTELANRVYFLESLQKRLAERSSDAERDAKRDACIVLTINLSRLKWINDSFGQAAGDALLKDLASELRKLMKIGDMLARVGGHEFAVLLDHSASVDAAKDIAHRLLQLFALPYNINEQEIQLRCQVGIASAAATTVQAEDLLSQAYVAMNQARNLSGNHFCVFDLAMRAETQKRLRLESDLHRALVENQFELYYQPIVSLAEENTICGFEALIRWRRADGSFTSPGDFIPVAEETGLIAPLGDWILQQACHQLEHWNQGLAEHVYVSVNISSLQLFQPHFVSKLGTLITRHKIKPGQLKLELTESVMVEDGPGVLRTMEELLALGCEIMIDDFGTGYSSLSYLSRFPAAVVKIDKSFIQNLGAGETATEDTSVPIIKAIVSLARDLGLSVVAEGIESAEAAHRLQAIGCDNAQGFYFSPPLPEQRATALLLQSRGATAQIALP